jgi:hypothetical protein
MASRTESSGCSAIRWVDRAAGGSRAGDWWMCLKSKTAESWSAASLETEWLLRVSITDGMRSSSVLGHPQIEDKRLSYLSWMP